MAMQADVHRQVQSARRALRGRNMAMIAPAGLGALVGLGLFAATVMPVIVTGAPWAPMVAVLPMLETGGLGAAIGVFVVGVAAVLLAIYAITLASMGLRRRA